MKKLWIDRSLLKTTAWTIGASIIVVGLLLTLLYGHTFGYFKSILWLTGFVVSVATTLLIVEPIKHIAFSLYMTLFTKGTHFDIDLGRTMFCSKIQAYRQAFHKHTQQTVQDASCWDDQSAKEETIQLLTEKYLIYYRDLTSDLFVFSLYLLTLLLVVLGSRDSMAFYSNRLTSVYAVKSKYVRGPLKPIIGDSDFHEYLSKVLVPTVHPNETQLQYSGWLPGKAVKLLGVVRLRQHRVREHCDIQQTHPSLLAQLDCSKWFQPSEHDMQSYNSGWQMFTDLPYRKFFPRMSEAWIYRTAWQTQTLPVFGQIHLYGGGGYVMNLGRSLANSQTVLRYVKKSGWIDRRTSVIFIEFTVYGVDSNLFNVVTITAERTPFGNYQFSTSIQTVKLLLVIENLTGAEIVAFFLYILLTVIFIIRFALKVLKRKLQKFYSNIWNVVDTVIVALSVGMVVLFFKRDQYVQNLLITMEQTRNNEFVSFFYAAFFDQLLAWWASILVTAATIRIWKICQFILVFRIISNTFCKAAFSLFCSTLVTCIFVVVIACIVHFINGPYTKTFSSLPKTITSLAVVSFGFVNDKINSRDMMFGGKWLGIGLHILLMVVVNIYLLNIFVTVVCYYFSEVRQKWQGERVPFTYWQFIKEEFTVVWCCCCMTRKTKHENNTEVRHQVTCLEKTISRMELIDFQLSVVSDALDRLLARQIHLVVNTNPNLNIEQ